MRKIFSLICRVLILVMMIGIVIETHKLINKYEKTEFIFPYDSFAHIEVKMEGFSITSAEEYEISATGSGVFIGFTEDGRQVVLTADHVCNPRSFGPFMPYTSKEISITDFYGNSFLAEVIKFNYEEDICALAIEGSDITPVHISDTPANYGEVVYNIAAPISIFNPGAVPLLDGYYSGELGGDSMYTIPAAPGSSGSGIFNSKGELIGITHSAIQGFQSVSISISHHDLEEFIVELYLEYKMTNY